MNWLHDLYNVFCNIVSIEPYSWHSVGTALFCSSIIGLERQLRGKPVGIRTSALITLGTYLFLATSFQLQNGVVDPSRVIGQVITGIGFLGAGVMLAKDGAVVGVTSAATIWVLAALGVIIANGYLLSSIKLSILVVTILYGIDLLEARSKAFSRGVHAKVQKFTANRRRNTE
ncbi:MAG: MgtC/SapB family protein [Spongiibacteraceae bacterium]